MLTQIVVDSENPFTLKILGVSPKDSLFVRTVDGLNPPDINLFIGDYARDGGLYQGRRVGTRNVVFTIDLNPNPALGETVQSLRELLYKAFIDPQLGADYLHITFIDDMGNSRYIVGYVEKFEGGIFEADASVQISIVCPDPYIRDLTMTEMNATGGGWLTTPPITYNGSAETGFETELYVPSDVPSLMLEVNGKLMVLNGTIEGGTVIYINTNAGSSDILSAATSDVTDRSAMSLHNRWHDLTNGLIPLGLTGSKLALLTPASRWEQMHLVNNVLRIGTTAIGTGPATINSLAFINSYWGV